MASASRKRARLPSEVPDELFESRLFPVGSHIFLIFISLFQLGCLLYFSPVLTDLIDPFRASKTNPKGHGRLRLL